MLFLKCLMDPGLHMLLCFVKRFFYFVVGANVHAETATKDTAITYACANGHTNVAALLLDYGADLVCVCVLCVLVAIYNYLKYL